MAGVHGLLHENAPNDPCNPSTVLRCHRFSASLVLGFVYAHHLSAAYPSRAAKDCCHPLHTGQSDRTERKAPCSKTAAKKYLMQQLLTGKKRLPGFDRKWNYVKANEIFKSIVDKSHDGKLEVLSSTQDKGIVPRSQVDIDIKYNENSLSTYKKVCEGDFVISLRSFQGGIEYSNYAGIVSPAYTVLRAIVKIDNGYYKQFFKSSNYIKRLNVAVYGIRDGKQISYDDFGQIKIPVPPIEEQREVAKVLSTADHEIDLLQKSIEAEKQKKKALMQLLLTGKVRVKI